MYTVLPSRIEPGFGYIARCSPDQCPTLLQGSTYLTQTGLGVYQAGPTPWHAPQGRAPWGSTPPLLLLLGVGVGPHKGAGPRGLGGAALGGTSGVLES